MKTIPSNLQLPVSAGAINPRNVVASYQRGGQTRPYLVRRYARLSTAMPRVMAYLIQNGEPRDTVDFYHLETGLFIGFLRVHAGGRLTGQFLKGWAMALPSIAELRKLLDSKIARDHVERMRKDMLRRRAGGYVAPPDRVELGTIPAGTVVDTSFFTHGLNRAFHLSAAGGGVGEADKDWTYDLQMVQHALVSRDRAVVTLPVITLPSRFFWSIAPTLEAAFVARYGSPAYVVHDVWEYGHTDGRIQVPLWLDQYVDQRLPRVVSDTSEAHRWERVVVVTGGSGSHFTVEDLP